MALLIGGVVCARWGLLSSGPPCPVLLLCSVSLVGLDETPTLGLAATTGLHSNKVRCGRNRASAVQRAALWENLACRKMVQGIIETTRGS